MNPTPSPTDKIGLREAILFYVGQAKSLGSVRADNELTDEICTAILAHFEATRPEKKVVYVGGEPYPLNEAVDAAIDTWDKDFKEGLE